MRPTQSTMRAWPSHRLYTAPTTASWLLATRSWIRRERSVSRLRVVSARHSGLLGGQDAWCDAFDDVADVQDGNTELDGTEHARVDDVARGAHHEKVAQAAVEDDLRSHPRGGTSKEDSKWRLSLRPAVAAVRILVRSFAPIKA